MSMFVHLAPASKLDRIRRTGIRQSRRTLPRPSGVYAVPVTTNYYISHQWLRELRRAGQGGTIAGIYFGIPDDELVWLGHYGGGHRQCTATEAAAAFLHGEAVEGWEVIIPRAIQPGEIHRFKSLPQVIGWRYSPGAKGKRPFCGCSFCTKGLFGARRLRQRFGDGEN